MDPAARRYSRRTFLTLVSAGAASACLPSGPSEPSPSPAATATAVAASASPRPGVGGTLAVYTTLEDGFASDLLGAFAKAAPAVRVDVLSVAPAEELEIRIRVERAGRKADIFLGGAIAHHRALADDGFLESYVSPAAAQIPASLKDATGRWAGWYEDLLGLAVNADGVGREPQARTATWDDLLDPVWQGRLLVPDPARTDAGYAFVATQLFRLDRDEARTIEYLKRLHANVARYVRDPAELVAAVSRGDALAAPVWGREALARDARRPGIALVAPKDALVELGAASILKGTASLDAARALVDWLAGRDAQAAVAGAGRVPARALVPAPAGAPSLAGLDVGRYDRRWAYDVRDGLLKRWRDAIGLRD